MSCNILTQSPFVPQFLKNSPRYSESSCWNCFLHAGKVQIPVFSPYFILESQIVYSTACLTSTLECSNLLETELIILAPHLQLVLCVLCLQGMGNSVVYIRFLGVTLDSSSPWTPHIQSATKCCQLNPLNISQNHPIPFQPHCIILCQPLPVLTLILHLCSNCSSHSHSVQPLICSPCSQIVRRLHSPCLRPFRGSVLLSQ